VNYVIDDIEVTDKDYFKIISNNQDTVHIVLMNEIGGTPYSTLLDNGFKFDCNKLAFMYNDRQGLKLEHIKQISYSHLVRAIRLIKMNPGRNVIDG